MSNEELKALIRQTVKEVLDEENPVYKDLKDVPEYWKAPRRLGLRRRQRRDAERGMRDRPQPPQGDPQGRNRGRLMYHEAREKEHNPSGPGGNSGPYFSSYGVFP